MEKAPKNELWMGKYEADKDGFINFGDIAHGELGMQTQYASRYVSGIDRPDLAKGLRTRGNPADYHELEIHKDDVEEFIARVKKYKSR